MSGVGRVDGLWRYPVKSMRGEELEEAFLGFAGSTVTGSLPSRGRTVPKGFPT